MVDVPQLDTQVQYVPVLVMVVPTRHPSPICACVGDGGPN